MTEELDNIVDEVNEELSGDELLAEALKNIKEGNVPEVDDEYEGEEEESPAEEEETPAEEELPSEEESTKPQQTSEENARFAEQRRQRQLDEQLKQTAEYKLAKQLEDMYGMPVDQLMKQIEDAKLQEEAKSQNIPVEVLRRQQETQNQLNAQKDEVAQLKFQLWDSRMKVEEQSLKNTYSMLTDQDLLDARMHLLESGQVDAPLERAVKYLHSDKIMKAEIEKAKQEWLAEQSGRKKSPVAIQGGKPKQTGSLTAEEAAVAKAMGISEEDYLKYK